MDAVRVAVRASGASVLESVAGRVVRPSRISRARLRSSAATSTDARLSAATSTDARVSSLSDEEEVPSLDDVGDVMGDVVGVDWLDSEWRKIEVRSMSPDLRPLLRNHDRRLFLTFWSALGSSMASGALGEAWCQEEGTVDLRSTSRDLLFTSWA